MSARQANFLRQLFALVALGAFILNSAQGAENATTQAVSGNAPPVITNLKLNDNNPITLIANTSTLVYLSFTISDNNGCGDVFASGTVTSTVYRTGVSGEGNCSFSYNSCYIQSTTTYSCVGSSTSANATTSFSIYYFADATDASSSYPSSTWGIQVTTRDGGGTTSTATSTGVELNTLTAIALPTSTLDFGTVGRGQNTSSTNQNVDVINVGNSSSTLNLSGTDMSSGGNTLTVDNLHYATGTFTYGGAEKLLSAAATQVTGWLTNHGPQIREWKTTTAMPFGNNRFSVAAGNGYMYSTGGEVGVGTNTSTVNFAPINSTGSVGVWTKTIAMPSARIAHTSLVLNNFLYTFGGLTSSVIVAPINSTGSIGAWQQTTPLPTSSDDFPLVEHNGFLYFMPSNSNLVYFATTSLIDGTVSSWTSTTPAPEGLTGSLGSFAVNEEKLYFTGVTSSVWFAEINSTGSIGVWQKSPESTPSAFAFFKTSVFSGSIYAIQGTGSAYVSRFVNGGATYKWQPISVSANNFFHGQTIYNGYLYILGGFVGSRTSTVSYAKLNSQPTKWGIGSPMGTPPGDYTGTITYTSVFSP